MFLARSCVEGTIVFSNDIAAQSYCINIFLIPDDAHLVRIRLISIGPFNHSVLFWDEIVLHVGAIQGQGFMEETTDVGIVPD